jgi:hypothetical protein
MGMQDDNPAGGVSGPGLACLETDAVTGRQLDGLLGYHRARE